MQTITDTQLRGKDAGFIGYLANDAHKYRTSHPRKQGLEPNKKGNEANEKIDETQ